MRRLKFIAFAITRRASSVKGFKTWRRVGGTGVLGGGAAANRRIVLCREMKKTLKMWVNTVLAIPRNWIDGQY